MLVPLRNACWIFVKLSNKLCVCTFISASTYLPNGCKDTKKYSINHSFLMKYSETCKHFNGFFRMPLHFIDKKHYH